MLMSFLLYLAVSFAGGDVQTITLTDTSLPNEPITLTRAEDGTWDCAFTQRDGSVIEFDLLINDDVVTVFGANGERQDSSIEDWIDVDAIDWDTVETIQSNSGAFPPIIVEREEQGGIFLSTEEGVNQMSVRIVMDAEPVPAE